MEQKIVFPGMARKSVRQTVFDILCTQWPLNITTLHSILKDKYNQKISYQGVRFVLNELTADGIVKKVGKEYMLDQRWINNLAEFSADLPDNYSEKKILKRFDLESTQVRVNNLAEMADFLLYALENRFFNTSGRKEMHLQFVHLWIPYADKSKRDRLRKAFMENRVYCLCQEKTFGDTVLAKYFRRWGQHIKTGVQMGLAADTWVVGDCVVQIFMPEKLRQKMKRAYSLSTKIFSFDKIDILTEMTFEKQAIDIIITRNSDVAGKVRQKVKGYFR